jgi:excinuclease UvrABC nuclease subunit
MKKWHKKGRVLDGTWVQPVGISGRWQYFDPTAWWGAPIKPGVYAFFSGKTPLYIGSSTCMAVRMKQWKFVHHDDLYHTTTPWGVYDKVWAKCRVMKKYGSWLMLEARLIQRLQPLHNTTHKEPLREARYT